MGFTPKMEVLTFGGWRRWDMLEGKELIAAPQPEDRSFAFEEVDILKEDYAGPLHVFNGERMSYGLTPDHRVWYSRTRGKSAEIYKAGEINGAPDFDPMSGYRAVEPDGKMDEKAMLATFWLGDGYRISKNRIGFGLKKERKKKYLHKLLKALGADYNAVPHKNRPGYEDFSVNYVDAVKEALETFIDDTWAVAKAKHLSREKLAKASPEEIRGLFNGFLNSDGHVKADRPQIQYHSISGQLQGDFQLLSALLGRDAHFTKHGLTLSYEPENMTALKCEGKNRTVEKYEGKTYTCKTSTGFVFVRGSYDKYAFVAGN